MTVSSKFALVTGTSSGIGLSTATMLLDRGWDVAGIARRNAPIAHDHYIHLRIDLSDLPTLTSELESRVASLISDPARDRIALVNNAASAALLAPVEMLDAARLASLYALNVVAPMWCMGFASRHCAKLAALRIVNVSSGAATHAFPGMAAYCSAKSALRMAGMVLATEWESTVQFAPTRHNASVFSYEPGTVDTAMQDFARSHPTNEFPWVGMFTSMQERGVLVSPDQPASEIVRLLESNGEPAFSERRFG
ncbi:MAG: SDR family NAD(P)-dependent oxidoreductase [Gemmatimonadaceae bacterium]